VVGELTTLERGFAVGKCSKCGKIITRPRPIDTAECDCWKHCPLCGELMEPYKPDLSPETYGYDKKREMKILMVCNRHIPPFLSTQKPEEVFLS